MSIITLLIVYLICFSGFLITEVISIKKRLKWLSEHLENTMNQINDTNNNILNMLEIINKFSKDNRDE